MVKEERKKGQKKTAIALLLLVLFTAGALFGCSDEKGSSDQTSEQKQEQQAQESSNAKSDEADIKAADAQQKKKKAKEKRAAEKKRAEKKAKEKRAAEKKRTEKKADKAKKATKEKTKRKTKSKDKKSKNKTANNSKSRKSKKNKGKKNKTKNECSIIIECKKLKGRGDLDPGTASLVPDDGYILKKKKIEVKKGDSVYDVLLRARDKYGFSLNIEDTQFGKYIAGIAGIEEKSCGDESGWKYSVNGSFPSKSCSETKVSGGEKIVWTFVLTA